MEQQEAKKWFRNCIAALAAMLLLVASAMVFVDPYFHYHGPFPFFSYRLNEERYINDGILRHFDYDAVITGTSMAQNFHPSEMDALFGTKAVKAPFSGAGYQELSQNLDRALSRNKQVETVLWAVDYNGLLREYDWQKYEDYPDYLYDDNPFNDVAYVFNKSILYHGMLPVLTMSLFGEKGTTMDEYSSWKNETGLAHIMLSYDRENVRPAGDQDFGEEERRIVTETVQKNIVDLVNKYPDTEFLLFYTPYSICYWDALNLMGTMFRQTEAERTATEMLLKCPNVKLYNFFGQHEVVCDTDYYNDDGHYSSQVNSMILTWIREDTGRVREDNYLELLEKERDFYGNYDYESIYRGLEVRE